MNSDKPTTEDLLSTAGSAEVQQRQTSAKRVVNLGLAANAVLAAAKLTAGVLGHSQALLADGINSISDVVYYVVVRLFVALSGKPADTEHPYGHHQFESIGALVVGAFVITTGIAILWDSVNRAIAMAAGNVDERQIRFFTIWVACATIIIKLFLMFNALGVSRRTGNIAVSALARDHRNDIFASAGAAVGILFGLMGHAWLDPVAGAVVAVVVTKTGIDILRESSADLMDSVPSREIDSQIRGLLSGFPGVRRVESIHAHRFGPYLMVNITIGVDGQLSVFEGNRIADDVEAFLDTHINLLRRIYVHYHPAEDTAVRTSPSTVIGGGTQGGGIKEKF